MTETEITEILEDSANWESERIQSEGGFVDFKVLMVDKVSHELASKFNKQIADELEELMKLSQPRVRYLGIRKFIQQLRQAGGK